MQLGDVGDVFGGFGAERGPPERQGAGGRGGRRGRGRGNSGGQAAGGRGRGRGGREKGPWKAASLKGAIVCMWSQTEDGTEEVFVAQESSFLKNKLNNPHTFTDEQIASIAQSQWATYQTEPPAGTQV